MEVECNNAMLFFAKNERASSPVFECDDDAMSKELPELRHVQWPDPGGSPIQPADRKRSPAVRKRRDNDASAGGEAMADV